MSARTRIVEGAAQILRQPDGPRLSLESAARQAGVSKPGLMYHFPTKAALVLGVVEHLIDRFEADLLAELGMPLDQATPQQRIRAYVRGSLTGAVRDRAHLALHAEHDDEIAEAWRARLEPWVRLPDDLPPDQRARLDAARLAADGAWIAIVTDILPPPEPSRPALLAALERLVDEP